MPIQERRIFDFGNTTMKIIDTPVALDFISSKGIGTNLMPQEATNLEET